jgi:dipeptidase E
MTRHIIALGGGGFSMEPENPVLDHYILQQTGKARPRVCFFPHATDDAVRYVRNFYEAFTKLDVRPSALSLFNPPVADLEAFLLAQDVIYVGGGNTRSMLALWREWDLDKILRKAYERGVILAGISAGAICWFEQGLTDSIPGDYTALKCLGFLPGSCSPHYDGEAMRRPTFHRLLAEGQLQPGLALDDGAAAHFVDGELRQVVTSRPKAKAYRLEVMNRQVVEQVLDVKHLLNASRDS